MTREELIKKVALKMDEISSSDDVIVAVDSSDNNPLYTQINGLLNESINDILTKAPIHRLTSFVDVVLQGNANTCDAPVGNRSVAVFNVPKDFIRLVSIVDTNFKRPIVELSFEGDEVDKRQHNKFLMAKSSKPVAVLGLNAEGQGENKITCYSYDKNTTPYPTMHYISRFEGALDLSSNITIDDYLADIVSWACAGRVFAAQGDVNKGQLCDNNATALMV